MPMPASSASGLFGENTAATLRLLALLMAAVALMVADHRAGWLDGIRHGARLVVDPMYRIAGAPVRLARSAVDAVRDRGELLEENRVLREQLLVANARLHRSEAVRDENLRLRELLAGTRGRELSVQLVNVVDIDLDPFRHRIVLDLGRAQDVREGQALLDAGGVFGQVLEVGATGSTAILVSDPSHAVPVQVQRTGLRTIAFGTGDTSRLLLPNLPPSADIRVGDRLVTSGLGGSFPAGFPVGEVTSLEPDPTRTFIVGEARPAAALARSGQLLLVWTDEATAVSGDGDTGSPGDAGAAPGAAVDQAIEGAGDASAPPSPPPEADGDAATGGEGP